MSTIGQRAVIETDADYKWAVAQMRACAAACARIEKRYKDAKARAHAAHTGISVRQEQELKAYRETAERLATAAGRYYAQRAEEGRGVSPIPGVAFETEYTYAIVDESRIPHAFWSIDESRIRAHIDAYGRRASIPGVQIFAEPKLTIQETNATAKSKQTPAQGDAERASSGHPALPDNVHLLRR